MVPDAVARPADEQGVAEILRHATAGQIPVTVAGAQSSTTGASITDRGVLLSMRRYDRILDIDPVARTARVQAGALVSDVKRAAAEAGLTWAPDPTSEAESGDDRYVVTLTPKTAIDLAEQFYRFELAIPIAGHVLSIDPFDEPNVAESKANTNKVLESLPLPTIEEASPSETLPWLREHAGPGDYVSLQAYVPFGQDDALESLRRRVRDHLGGAPVTAGYGPRFLHSTGQLHKGGPNSVVAVQLVRASTQPELAIPEKPYDFGTLITAQSIGDHQSLLSHGRRVLRVAVDDLGEIV